MTILKESERVLALKYYDHGWSFQEITERILELRNEAISVEMTREVTQVIAHRFSKGDKR